MQNGQKENIAELVMQDKDIYGNFTRSKRKAGYTQVVLDLGITSLVVIDLISYAVPVCNHFRIWWFKVPALFLIWPNLCHRYSLY